MVLANLGILLLMTRLSMFLRIDLAILFVLWQVIAGIFPVVVLTMIRF